MDHLKQQLERRLIANLLIDRCKLREDIIIREAWCTQDRVIRFTSKRLRALFPPISDGGFDGTGEIALYEAENNAGEIRISCRFFSENSKSQKASAPQNETFAIELFYRYQKPNDAIFWFDSALDELIPGAEEKHIAEIVKEAQPEVLTEGAARSFTATRYERNRRAREICLAYHGKSCAACGINFERDYGPQFADIIEVHHIVPVSQIAESYVVDPINDLVPLCPNCHTAIHSAKDGVYAKKEFFEIIKNTKN